MDSTSLNWFAACDLIKQENVVLPVCNTCKTCKFDTGKKAEWTASYMVPIYRCACEENARMYVTPSKCDLVADNFKPFTSKTAEKEEKAFFMPELPIIEQDELVTAILNPASFL